MIYRSNSLSIQRWNVLSYYLFEECEGLRAYLSTGETSCMYTNCPSPTQLEGDLCCVTQWFVGLTENISVTPSWCSHVVCDSRWDDVIWSDVSEDLELCCTHSLEIGGCVSLFSKTSECELLYFEWDWTIFPLNCDDVYTYLRMSLQYSLTSKAFGLKATNIHCVLVGFALKSWWYDSFC